MGYKEEIIEEIESLLDLPRTYSLFQVRMDELILIRNGIKKFEKSIKKKGE